MDQIKQGWIYVPRRRKLIFDNSQYGLLIRDSIKDAIQNKKIIEFDYDGHNRIAEPHVPGISNERY